jgi:hypothetical protein
VQHDCEESKYCYGWDSNFPQKLYSSRQYLPMSLRDGLPGTLCSYTVMPLRRCKAWNTSAGKKDVTFLHRGLLCWSTVDTVISFFLLTSSFLCLSGCILWNILIILSGSSQILFVSHFSLRRVYRLHLTYASKLACCLWVVPI